MYENLKIGFFGDGPWAQQFLNKILRSNDISMSFVCTRYNFPDKELKKLALKNKINVLVSKNVNSLNFIKKIRKHKADLFVSMSFNQIFKKEIIELPHKGIINCHAGKLPFYRGRSILNWVLINDEKEFGITVHYINKQIDSGDIILQKTFPINDNDDFNSLLNISYKECPKILYKSIKLIKHGKVKTVSQKSIHKTGSYFKKRKKGDEIINWNQSSREIFNFVRALSKPGIVARTFLNGKRIMINKIDATFIKSNSKNIPGKIANVKDDHFLVHAKDSVVKVTEWFTKDSIKQEEVFK